MSKYVIAEVLETFEINDLLADGFNSLEEAKNYLRNKKNLMSIINGPIVNICIMKLSKKKRTYRPVYFIAIHDQTEELMKSWIVI